MQLWTEDIASDNPGTKMLEVLIQALLGFNLVLISSQLVVKYEL